MRAIADRFRRLFREVSPGAGFRKRKREADFREARIEKRQRTRLRSAKALDSDGKWICDCAILDQSAGGLRLRRLAGGNPPILFSLYDDQTTETLGVTVAWRDGPSIGVRILHRDGVAHVRPVERRMYLPYYAVRD